MITVALAHPPRRVQAGFGYAMSVLKGGGGQRKLLLDAQNRVQGQTDFFQRYRLEKNRHGGWLPKLMGLRIVAVREPAPAVWSDTPRAKVSPARHGPRHARWFGASPSGDQWLMLLDGPDETLCVLDQTTGARHVLQKTTDGYPIDRHIGFNPQAEVAVNDQGWVASSYRKEIPGLMPGYRPALWRPGRAGQPLPMHRAFEGARAYLINAQGTVAGEAYEAVTGHQRAVRWVSGGPMEVLDTRPDWASAPVSINDAGQILLRSWRRHGRNDEASWSVVLNGTITPVMSNMPGFKAVAQAMNASGTVVGFLRPMTRSPWGQATPSTRAFIWKNGVMTDLTRFVTSKGVKLPEGVVLSQALAINDQDSIVAAYLDERQNTIQVRLQVTG